MMTDDLPRLTREERRPLDLKMSPSFRQRYPEAAALAEKLSLNVRYGSRVYWAMCRYAGTLQLTGYHSRDIDGRSMPLTEEEQRAMPLKLLRDIEQGRRTMAPARERFSAMLDAVRTLEPRYKHIGEYLDRTTLDTGSVWPIGARYIVTIRLHDVPAFKAEAWDLRQCFELLANAASDIPKERAA